MKKLEIVATVIAGLAVLVVGGPVGLFFAAIGYASARLGTHMLTSQNVK